MPEVQLPTVDVSETAARRPISAVGTAIAAFVGLAESGPIDEPVRVETLAEFTDRFGRKAGDSWLGRAVADFFANGGRTAVVVRAGDTALEALDGPEPFQLLVVDPGSIDLSAAADLCGRRRALLLLDADPDGTVPEGLGEDAAAYHPAITDPAGVERPCAPAVAGVFARSDATRGVWASPAGTALPIQGAAGLARPLSDSDLGYLSVGRVNALRTLPDGSVVVWGARTLSSDPEWKYVAVRRLLLFLEASIDAGLQWAVSEPNDESLWSQVRNEVGIFLDGLWRSGAFPGRTADEAYFVRCDRSTMTQEDLDQGHLVVMVGVATVRPAEFTVLRVTVSSKSRRDPYSNFNFRVSWSGRPVAGFSRISAAKWDVGRQRQGGSSVEREPLELGRGISLDEEFRAWVARSAGLLDGAAHSDRDLVVEARDESGEVSTRYAVRAASVRSITGGGGAIETLLLDHGGWERITGAVGAQSSQRSTTRRNARG